MWHAIRTEMQNNGTGLLGRRATEAANQNVVPVAADSPDMANDDSGIKSKISMQSEFSLKPQLQRGEALLRDLIDRPFLSQRAGLAQYLHTSRNALGRSDDVRARGEIHSLLGLLHLANGSDKLAELEFEAALLTAHCTHAALVAYAPLLGAKLSLGEVGVERIAAKIRLCRLTDSERNKSFDVLLGACLGQGVGVHMGFVHASRLCEYVSKDLKSTPSQVEDILAQRELVMAWARRECVSLKVRDRVNREIIERLSGNERDNWRSMIKLAESDDRRACASLEENLASGCLIGCYGVLFSLIAVVVPMAMNNEGLTDALGSGLGIAGILLGAFLVGPVVSVAGLRAVKSHGWMGTA